LQQVKQVAPYKLGTVGVRTGAQFVRGRRALGAKEEWGERRERESTKKGNGR